MENYCPHCGAKMVAYKQHLTSGLVSCLSKAIAFVHQNNKNEFHLQRDPLGLTKSEFTNFQKLRYFALVAQVDGKDGYWLITSHGGAFLRNAKGMPAWVETYRNKIQSKSNDLMFYRDFRDKVPYFESDFEYAGYFPDPQQTLDIPVIINQKKSPDLHDPKTLLQLCQ